MASFVQRALMYLGLKDIEDEDDYDHDDEEASETAASRVRQSSYPEPAPPRASVATVRPIARDDGPRTVDSGGSRRCRTAVCDPTTFQAPGSGPRPLLGRAGDRRHGKGELACHRQPAGEREGPRPAHDRLLLRSDLCSRGVDGEGRRIGVPTHTVERRGFPRGAPAPSRERTVPVLRLAEPTKDAGLIAREQRLLTYLIDVLNLFLFVLVVRVVLSYFPMSPGSALVPITRFFEAITEPVLRPVRRIVPPLRSVARLWTSRRSSCGSSS